MATYAEKLKDPRWQRRRLEILNRADFSCEECGGRDKTLHVHHKQYRSGAEPWEYADTELQSLCEDCHSEVTHLLREIKEKLSQMGPDNLQTVLGYIDGFLILTAQYYANPDSPERLSWGRTAVAVPTNPSREYGFGNAMGVGCLESHHFFAGGPTNEDAVELYVRANFHRGSRRRPQS